MNTDELAALWWYYSVELVPGKIARGIYPDRLPMLPRMMLRGIHGKGRALDVGCMEGLMCVEMVRRGFEVLANDASDHCINKLQAVAHAHKTDFQFCAVPSVYRLQDTMPGAFDLINLSGLLYHVVSPLAVMLGARSILKRNGVMILSTNVMAQPGYFAQFNGEGALQPRGDTFWYPGIDLLAYWTRCCALKIEHAMYLPHEHAASTMVDSYVGTVPSGYLCLMLRAVDTVEGFPASLLTQGHDMRVFGSPDQWGTLPVSTIETDGGFTNPWEAVGNPTTTASNINDSHTLML